MKKLVFIFFLFLIYSCSVYRPRQLNGKFKIDIPYKVVNNWIILETEVANKKGDFIFDTGAKSLLFSDIDSTLSGAYPRIFTTKMNDVNSSNKNGIYKFYSTIFGKIALDNYRYLVINRPAFLDFKCSKDTLLGFIGNDILNQGIFSFNHTDSLLTVYGEVNQIPNLSSFHKEKIKLKNGYLYIQIEGITYLIDSGDSGDFLTSYKKDIIDSNKSTKSFQILTSGAFSDTIIHQVSQNKCINVFNDTYCGKVNFENERKNNLFGSKWFLENDIIIDVVNKDFYIRKGTQQIDFIENNDVSINYFDNFLRITAVNSEINNCSVGDVILEINGISTQNIKNRCDFQNWMLELKGKFPERLLILHNDEKVILELK